MVKFASLFLGFYGLTRVDESVKRDKIAKKHEKTLNL